MIYRKSVSSIVRWHVDTKKVTKAFKQMIGVEKLSQMLPGAASVWL